ncbi:MAG: DUF5719 family protein [Acidobacteriota bacterium]
MQHPGYAGTDEDGVFRSTDGGSHWTAVNNGLPAQEIIWDMVIDPVTPSNLYVCTYISGVYKSVDGGENWTAVNTGIPISIVSVLAIDPVNPAILYAGTASNGVFQTTDGGAHWTSVNDGLTDSYVYALAVDPSTPSTVYAAAGSGGVFRSTNSGGHWDAVNHGLSNLYPFSLAIDPVTPSTLYVGSLSGVFRSTDSGDSWAPFGEDLPLGSVYDLTVDPSNPSTLYAGTDRGVDRFQADCSTYFAQFGNGQGLSSDIVLTNPSPTRAVAGRLRFADHDGLPLDIGVAAQSRSGFGLPLSLQSAGGADFSIPPQGDVTFSTDGMGDLAVGSASVTTDGTLGGVVRFSIPGTGIAGVGTPAPVRGFIAPARRIAGTLRTGVAIYNTEIRPVSLELSLRNEQGEELPGGQRTMEQFPALGHLAKFINELFPEADTTDFSGTLIVEVQGGKVVATALETGATAGEFTTLPVTPITTATTQSKSTFAQFGSGEGLVSDLVLVNPSMSGSISGTMSFFDDQGQPMTVGIAGLGPANSQGFTIGPWGSVTISTEGAGALDVGSAQVTADGPLGGVVRFHLPGAGIAGVGGSRPLSEFLIPVRRTAEGISTGIALENAGDSPVVVDLTLRGTDGTPVPGGTETITDLPAHGHVARFLKELFGSVDTEGFSGTVSVAVGGGTVAATALELGKNPGEFTTLPVTPAN